MDPGVRAQSATVVTSAGSRLSDPPVSHLFNGIEVAPPHRLFEDQMYSSL